MIVAIIQARMGSTRLPGKVMKDLAGKPVLARVVQRVHKSQQIDDIIIATSKKKENDPIRDFCQKHSIHCFSGSEENVLERFIQAAETLELKPDDLIVRITADCPLIDPDVIDSLISMFNKHKPDYASNVLTPTFPDGLDCEVMTLASLHTSKQEASDPSFLEHVTLYMRQHPDHFSLLNVTHDPDLSHHRWTLDEPEDYRFMQYVFSHFGDRMFGKQEILEYLGQHPNLSKLNSHIKRNEGSDS